MKITTKYLVTLTEDPAEVTCRPELIGTYHSEAQARAAAADTLGVRSLRGLRQAPTDRGTRYYGRGSDMSVTVAAV